MQKPKTDFKQSLRCLAMQKPGLTALWGKQGDCAKNPPKRKPDFGGLNRVFVPHASFKVNPWIS